MLQRLSSENRIALRPGEQVAQKEGEVSGTLGQAAHEVRKPVRAVGNVNAKPEAVSNKLLLQIGTNSVEHLELELFAADIFFASELLRCVNHGGIMSSDAMINPAGQY
jgi:hypothetical protein